VRTVEGRHASRCAHRSVLTSVCASVIPPSARPWAGWRVGHALARVWCWPHRTVRVPAGARQALCGQTLAQGRTDHREGTGACQPHRRAAQAQQWVCRVSSWHMGAWHDFVGVLACLDERALPPRRVVARCLEGRILRRACPCARRRLPTAAGRGGGPSSGLQGA